jgi:hypothetical protein
MNTRLFGIAIIWYVVSFGIALAGAAFSDSHGFVTNAWHVYFIGRSAGVLTTDNDIAWSESYRLVMAAAASLACLICFLHRFNTKSPRNDVAATLTTWERRAIAFFALVLLFVTLVALPANLHKEILKDEGALPAAASLGDDARAIERTLFSPFPGGEVIVKGDPDLGRLARAFSSNPAPTNIESVTIWRSPDNRLKSTLIAIGDAGGSTPASESEARVPLELGTSSSISSIARRRLGSESHGTYFAQVWRPYLMPYSLYSVGLWLLIIFPVTFFMIRSAKEDWLRFRSKDLLRAELPPTASENSLEEYQKRSEHRLDAIRDIVPRYLAVFFIVCLVATVEYGVSYIRSSSTAQAATFGQIDLIAIWVSCLVLAFMLMAFYYNEYGYAFAGFQDMESLASGPLYEKVRGSKNDFRGEYASIKVFAGGSLAVLILVALLWVLQKLGTSWMVPFACGVFPAGFANQIVHAMHASKLTTVSACVGNENHL